MSWIFDSMNCKFTGYSQLIKNKSPGYSGPMRFESYGSLQISLTFGGLRLNLMDIPDLWSANLLNIWGLWSANLLDIWAIWSTISLIFGTYEGRISWMFVNLLDQRGSKVFWWGGAQKFLFRYIVIAESWTCRRQVFFNRHHLKKVVYQGIATIILRSGCRRQIKF